MIRINLLPFRLARKRENIRRQISIFFLSILLILFALTWYTLRIDKTIERKKQETARIVAQIALYKEKADRVGEIKKKLKILEDKLKIVESLKHRRKEQLTLLEVLPEKLVPERMWIESMRADEAMVTMTGIAFDNPTIADFMRRLESSDLFTSVDLKRASIKRFEQGVNLKSFDLVCKKKAPEPEAEKAKKKGK